MTEDDSLYLIHMLERVRNIEEDVQGGAEVFFGSRTIRDAVIRNLEVLGEAAKRVSPATRQAYPGVPWRRIAGLRDVLIHRYERVDANEIWRIAEREMANLRSQLVAILRARGIDPEQIPS